MSYLIEILFEIVSIITLIFAIKFIYASIREKLSNKITIALTTVLLAILISNAAYILLFTILLLLTGNSFPFSSSQLILLLLLRQIICMVDSTNIPLFLSSIVHFVIVIFSFIKICIKEKNSIKKFDSAKTETANHISSKTCFEFGKYQHGENGEMTPIKRRILKNSDGRMSIISETVLDIDFDNEIAEAAWEEDFLNEAFTPKEKQKIIPFTLDNSTEKLMVMDLANADELIKKTNIKVAYDDEGKPKDWYTTENDQGFRLFMIIASEEGTRQKAKTATYTVKDFWPLLLLAFYWLLCFLTFYIENNIALGWSIVIGFVVGLLLLGMTALAIQHPIISTIYLVISVVVAFSLYTRSNWGIGSSILGGIFGPILAVGLLAGAGKGGGSSDTGTSSHITNTTESSGSSNSRSSTPPPSLTPNEFQLYYVYTQHASCTQMAYSPIEALNKAKRQYPGMDWICVCDRFDNEIIGRRS
ncbi:MAG: hypothetical protein Q4D13_09045 [Erysipelotrichaceae bacterium]|nr:hypothetical protein [Erysipelotrichaceae bacterium]